jgi:hypothetical protein
MSHAHPPGREAAPGELTLAGEVQRRTARRQQRQARTRAHEVGNKGNGRRQVLEVVQNHQCPPVPQMLAKGL